MEVVVDVDGLMSTLLIAFSTNVAASNSFMGSVAGDMPPGVVDGGRGRSDADDDE